MDAYGSGDQYSVLDTPRFMTVEGMARLQQFGVPVNMECQNVNPMLIPSPYNQRFGITLGTVEDRRNAVLSAAPCETLFTDGKINNQGKGGSFLNIGGAGAEYRRADARENSGNSEQSNTKEKYHNSDEPSNSGHGDVNLSLYSLLFILIIVVAFVLSLYSIKRSNDIIHLLNIKDPQN